MICVQSIYTSIQLCIVKDVQMDAVRPLVVTSRHITNVVFCLGVAPKGRYCGNNVFTT